MDIYRTFTGPFPGCQGYVALQVIYAAAMPPLPGELTVCSLEALEKRRSKMFFPRETIYQYLSRDRIQTIINCGCVHCVHRHIKSRTEFDKLVDWVERESRILLAILIYLGQTHFIEALSHKSDTINDGNLDGVITIRRPVGLPPDFNLKSFKESYQMALYLFRPAMFIMGRPIFQYDEHQRFPYLRDEPHAKGSFGEVRKFDIHPDYVHQTLHDVYPQLPWRSGNGLATSPCMFARKIVRKGLAEEELQMERDVLYVVAMQKHPNIIDLIAFYTWRDEVNFIFPFIELNLYDVLYKDRTPEKLDQAGRFPNHWLWKQILEIAGALNTIHDPPIQPWPAQGNVIGFHFDLKPANILVTSNGILKITDFGQSMIKLVQGNEQGYGAYIGGDSGYQPPEVCPSREKVKLAVMPSDLTDTTIPISSVNTRYAHATSNSLASQRSSLSLRPSESIADSHGISNAPSLRTTTATSDEPTVTATCNYDVWSLACMMIEVLVYVFKNGSKGVISFRDARQDEDWGRGLAFHNGNVPDGEEHLKSCVRSELESLRHMKTVDSIPLVEENQPVSFMNDVVDLLYKMLRADPSKRVSSHDVVSEFEELNKKHQEMEDPESELVRYLRDDGTPEGFKEVGWAHNNRIVSYSLMTSIKLEVSEKDILDCRLQVFYKTSGGVSTFCIRICYYSFSGKLRCVPYTFSANDAFYCPIYLYDSDRRTACGIYDKNYRLVLHFISEDITTNRENLMTFQSLILRQNPTRGIRISCLELRPRVGRNELYDNLNIPGDWPTCQIWVPYRPEELSERPVNVAIANREETVDPMAILFCGRGEGFFGFFLQDGKKMVEEQSVNPLDETTRVIIKCPDHWTRYFYTVRPNGEGRMRSFDAPGIPLSKRWYKNDAEDEGIKATRVEITFENHNALRAFRAVVRIANEGNPHPSNCITWKAAVAGRLPRPRTHGTS